MEKSRAASYLTSLFQRQEELINGEPTVDNINKLLQQSFGRKTRGNLRYRTFQSGHDNPFFTIDGLECISRIKAYIFEGIIGRFEEDDGSSLVVFPKYKTMADRFSELYERSFGKRPQVVLAEKPNFSHRNPDAKILKY